MSTTAPLSVHTLNVQSDAVCRICLEPLFGNNFEEFLSNPKEVALSTIACGHCYHTDCLKDWYRNRHVCPLCIRTIHEPSESSREEVRQQDTRADRQRRMPPRRRVGVRSTIPRSRVSNGDEVPMRVVLSALLMGTIYALAQKAFEIFLSN